MEGRCQRNCSFETAIESWRKGGKKGAWRRYVPVLLILGVACRPGSDQWRVVDCQFGWSRHSISHSDPSETWNSGPTCGGATHFRRCGAVIPTKSTLSSQLAKLRNSGGPRSPPSTNYPGNEAQPHTLTPQPQSTPNLSNSFHRACQSGKKSHNPSLALTGTQPFSPALASGRAWLARKEQELDFHLSNSAPRYFLLADWRRQPTTSAPAKRARLSQRMKISVTGKCLLPSIPSSTTVR